MQIETYEIQANPASPVEAVIADAEHIALLEELELTEQKSLAGTSMEDIKDLDAPSRPSFRFRAMTVREQNIYKVLCPNETSIKSYNSDLIPLRVLRAYKEARDSGYCTEGFVVWHPENAKEDPILVGKRRDKYWATTLFIIARWGSVLKPLSELQKEAEEIWTSKIRAKLTRIKNEVDRELISIGTHFNETVNDRLIVEPAYNSAL